MQEQINDHEARLKKLEQKTEPIDIDERVLLQTIMTMVGQQATSIGVLQHAVERIETNMEKRFEVIKSLQEQILDRLPPKA